MKLELIFGGNKYRFNPESDITAFQLASIIMLQEGEFLPHQYASIEDFIECRGLNRHFEYVCKWDHERTIQAIRTLREKTGEGMMDCKKAMMACDFNTELAIEWLKNPNRQNLMLVTRSR